jgi:hypothetical protein
MGWDWAKQEAETLQVIGALLLKPDLYRGMEIQLDVQTIDGGRGRFADYAKDLQAQKLSFKVYDGNEDFPETVEVQFPKANLSFDSIWPREKRVTEIALSHGFEPDGWGFASSGDTAV